MALQTVALLNVLYCAVIANRKLPFKKKKNIGHTKKMCGCKSKSSIGDVIDVRTDEIMHKPGLCEAVDSEEKW